MKSVRLILAFLVAPAAPALLFVLPALFDGVPLASIESMFLIVCSVTYAHAVLLGAPATWLVNRFSSLTLLRVAITAFLIGAVPFGSLMLYQEATMPQGAGYSANGVVLREDGRLTKQGMQNTIFGVLQLGGLGVASGVIWWLIAGSNRKAPAQ